MNLFEKYIVEQGAESIPETVYMKEVYINALRAVQSGEAKACWESGEPDLLATKIGNDAAIVALFSVAGSIGGYSVKPIGAFPQRFASEKMAPLIKKEPF
jgi:hypothetical protein